MPDSERKPETKPRYTPGEELANALTHGAGLVASVVGTVLMVALTATQGDGWQLASSLVYGTTLISLYTASTLYHALPTPRQKRIMRVLDHSAIYLLIAGTYTPFALVVLRDEGRGWALFGAVWAIAAAGVVFKVLFTGRLNALSTAVYVGMGWLCVIVARPLIESLDPAALLLLAGGGVAYTAGVAFYANRRLPYAHAVWHGFVVTGSLLQFLAIYGYVLVPAI
ncbi:hlyIII: channel protein, hemolysin III family [Rubrobacter radiotolerans]|uniref:Hemolysin III family protein n=1 Tax=Rubrobacter radiotolerans TaxID=42256 RepID=A0A023X2Q6_RUBRA|nr:hemolysin III family protein [Rubrobacter radiotolerans]AHY46598.1 hlyIII: channel protein, hemolysin III family [Rubrobacter radiotolerans]MDX5894005.1 hemolysin III family protein [Rubrobacter radiotolerans]SMC04955.1 hemolysin III [Rubrobacter radiotolerans DSM 5868]